MANVREIAVNLLAELEQNKAYSNIALNKIITQNNLSSMDKGLLTALFYGVLDRKITLDFVISKFLKTPINKLKPITKQALRIAVFQIMFMDKIPESAAVNESVNIVKKSKERYNASFTNRVLRSLLRNPVELPQDDSLKSLSIRYSCPENIIKGFVEDYALETAKELLAQALQKPPITLRVNNTKITAEQLIKLLKDEGYLFKMLFVGSGQDETRLNQLIASLSLENEIILTGKITDISLLEKLYARAKLFLFPSLYDANSLVQIESACQSTPTVFSR
jgi:16S rRNA (cytosine967-C5)-methyltransferase